MKANIIYALRELGIDITDVQYKYPVEGLFGFDEQTKFVLKGAFSEDMDVRQIVDEIFILRSIAKNTNPAVKDLYAQLKTTAGLTSE